MITTLAQGIKPVDGFFKVCMGSLGNIDQAKAIAQKIGVSPASEYQKQSLLRHDSVGSVYVGENIAIALEQSGLCTIFSYTDDPIALQEELKQALPPPSTPFKVREKPISGNANATGTVYHLELPTGPFADWFFNSYNQAGRYNVAISMQTHQKN